MYDTNINIESFREGTSFHKSLSDERLVFGLGCENFSSEGPEWEELINVSGRLISVIYKQITVVLFAFRFK